MSIQPGRWITQDVQQWEDMRITQPVGQWEDMWSHTLNIQYLTLGRARFTAKFLAILASHPHILQVILIHPIIDPSIPPRS